MGVHSLDGETDQQSERASGEPCAAGRGQASLSLLHLMRGQAERGACGDTGESPAVRGKSCIPATV